MNQPVAQPDRLRPAACPLLAAVLPVRYAIGPIDPRNPSTLDASTLGLPNIQGLFPELGPDHPQLQDRPLGYVPRMLRDGWLYVWEDGLQELSEYRVEASLLKPTARGGRARTDSTMAYLLLESGAPVCLAWSPVEWSADIFAETEQNAGTRQRLMRELIPGAAPFSGAVRPLHSQIGDAKPENYRWSCASEPKSWLLEEPPLKRMQRCEQQHFALLDDPWGVLFDLAALLRARNQAFDKLNRHRDEWSIAAVVKSVSDSDKEIRDRLASMVDVPRLQSALREQEREQEALETDLRRIAELWVAWFSTLGRSTPADLESACEHFDITRPDQRDTLEASFAAACLGPASTPPGVKAIEEAMDLDRTKGQPWLLWAVLGAARKVGPGELKQLLHIPEGVSEAGAEAGAAAGRLARATAITLTLNLGADRLQSLAPAGGGEPLFAALSSILAGRLRTLSEQIAPLAYNLTVAMLVRSQQRMDVEQLRQVDALRWLSEQMGQAHNKGQRRRIDKRIEQIEREQARTARTAPGTAPSKSPTAIQVEDAIPHLRVVPAPQPAPLHSQPGYGSDVPRTVPNKPAPVLPPLSGDAAKLELPRNIGELLDEAPLKTLIALVAAWNIAEVGKQTWADMSAKNVISATSAIMATATASTAILQQLADTRWEQHVAKTSHIDPGARKLLADALGLASFAMLFQAITAAIDVFYFGWQALDAFRTGDLDTAAVSTALAGANLGYARVSLQAMRALRVARAAALAGEAEALVTGIRVLSLPLRLSLVGLTVTIFIGMISLIYTQDTPLEQWIKQTRFGIRPADWSGDFTATMRAFYKVVLPVSLTLERWNDIDPRSGQWVNELRLVLRLPGQREYRQGMVSFDGHEEWKRSSGLLGSAKRCVPLIWGEDDLIPFDLDIGSRVTPEPDGSARLRRAYHEDVEDLAAIRGSLTYQPVEGLYLPPIDIDLS
ncbi:toxin VasX [Stutzerimonas azotifigens]|uniref:Toxin VasX N-terminal region domain-containing protein n=1 Tax=Stutzerimonas azotifigens TaxID=291995 RepID=A0ABR5Z475_9GAMM|nr:toxin VasX [Stutzerimonas azotifigens]MBA1274950.1 hypothetical protein [Stutzerimonas azotifigens]